MGQIVIDIPVKTNRRFVLESREQAELLLTALEASAVQVKKNPARLTKRQIENAKIYRSSMKNISEMIETGEHYTVDELREEFGLV
jgi:hypothetical protein